MKLGSSTFSTHGKGALAPKFTFPSEGCDVGERLQRKLSRMGCMSKFLFNLVHAGFA